MNVISSLEHSKRLDELTKEVLDVLGQPQQERPEDESGLSTKHSPGEYMERWGKLWKKWEDHRITSTEEYWRIWGGEMWSMFFIQPQKQVTISRPVLSCRQPMSDHFVSELETMKATVEGSRSYVPSKIAQVADTLESGRYLSRQRRHQMAQALLRVQDVFGQGFKKVGDGITALLKTVKDGLLPETKGYKALQEHFAEFLQGISHLSTLHDLAVKAYSKGLISENAKERSFCHWNPPCHASQQFSWTHSNQNQERSEGL